MQAYQDILEKLSKDYSYKCLYEIIFGNGNRIAAQFSDADNQTKQITYSEYEQRITSAACALSAALHGSVDSFIGLSIANSPDWSTLFWAILKSGNNALFLSTKEPQETTRHLLGEAGAIALISESDDAFAGVQTISPQDILSTNSEHPLPGTFGDKVAVCTSGTTGASRVFVYDGASMGRQIYSAKGFIPANRDLIYAHTKGPLKALIYLPFSHIFGFVANYMWFSCAGKTLVYPKDNSPETILQTCRASKVTHIFCVPLFWNNIASGVQRRVLQSDKKSQQLFSKMCERSLKLQKLMPRLGRAIVTKFIFKKVQQKLFGTSIRFLISGGGHILPETLRIINALGYPLYNGYGMSEVGITSVELSHNVMQRLLGRVGRAFNGLEYKIDNESGRDGELLISGESIHSGQMVKGKYIERTLDWFKTGDICNLKDGELFIDGRIKEVIVSESGINVYPDVVEDSFVGLVGVSEFCVLSLDTGGSYEEVALVLELNEDISSLDIRKIALMINAINQTLPHEKKVRIVLVSEEPLPLISGIKVQRQRLKQAIENGTHSYSILDLSKRNLINKKYRDVAKVLERDGRFSLLKEQIREILADVLVLNTDSITDHDLFFDDLGGDSLTVIGLAAKIEETLNVTIPFSELSAMPDINVFALTEITYRRKYVVDEEPLSESAAPGE